MPSGCHLRRMESASMPTPMRSSERNRSSASWRVIIREPAVIPRYQRFSTAETVRRVIHPGVVGATIQGGSARRRDEATHEDTTIPQDPAGGDGRRFFCLQWERATSHYDGRRDQDGCAHLPIHVWVFHGTS